MQPKPRLRIFLDSNVIFSGLYSSEGAPGLILTHCIKGKFKAIISRQVLDEVVRTIKDKLPEALPALRKLLVRIPWEIIKDPAPEEVTKWSRIMHTEDTVILAAAIAAQPNYLVIGNNKHFLENPEIAKKSVLQIVTPVEFLKILEEK